VVSRTIDRRTMLGMLAGGALAGGVFAMRPSRAAEFPVPGKPVKLLVGYPAGGGTDVQARALGRLLSPLLDVPVLIDNRPGAGTMIAATELSRLPPDGHALMYTPASTLAQLPHTVLALKYDPFRDFTPVAQCALGPVVLVVHESVPAANARELTAYARAHPGKLNYVSQGAGTSAHIFGQMLAQQMGAEMVHVPYKGANDVASDFVAGLVHMQFASSSGAVALARSGKVRMLAVVAPRRSGLFPDLPTMGELGFQGMDLDTALGVIGPAGMSPATVARLGDALRQVVADPKVQEDFRVGGVEPLWAGPSEFSRTIRDSHDAWGRMLAAINYKKQ